MSILDRYLIRQIVPPFLLALGILTFVLAIQPMLENARLLLSRGVPIQTVAELLVLLLPAALSLTLPMAFLVGLLMALGRLSGDRESVALLACGVSPLRLLRPVLALGLVVGAADLYCLMWGTPNGNLRYTEITWRLLVQQSSADVRPRVFDERFPGKVLYVRDADRSGRWRDVLLADTTDPGKPVVTLASSGGLVIDRDQKLVRLVLSDAAQYSPGQSDDRVYTLSRSGNVTLEITPSAVFGSGQLLPGIREKGPVELRQDIDVKRKAGIPAHAEIMHLQQMYAFPVACLVFGAIGLALGLNTRREGRLAGLTLGLIVILLYYALFALAEAWTKGVAKSGAPVDVVALWARWMPNVALGVLGVLALWRQTRPNGLNLPGVLGGASRQRVLPSTPAPGAGDPAPVVVVRLPYIGFPVPRLLDRYVGGMFLRSAALAFLALLSLYYIFTTVDLSDKLFKGQASAGVLVSYLIHSTPQFIAYLLPMAVLVAGLATIGGLTRSGELTVMRACGVSLYRAALPLLVVALGGSVLLFVLDDRVIGEANRTASMLRDVIRESTTPHTLSVANRNWLVGEDGRFYTYALLEPPGRTNGMRPTLHRLSVFNPATDTFHLESHLFAARVQYEAGQWRADGGWRQTFAGDEATRLDFGPETLALASLEDFRRADVDSSAMTFGQLWEYVSRLGASGYNVAEQRVTLHRKIAYPLVTIIMVLVAIPFGVTIGRKGAMYGIGLAAILATGYFLLATFFTAAGAAGLVPAMLAAWGANIIFGSGALAMILSVRT